MKLGGIKTELKLIPVGIQYQAVEFNPFRIETTILSVTPDFIEGYSY